jgi:inorganic triphosphatase YgiF
MNGSNFTPAPMPVRPPFAVPDVLPAAVPADAATEVELKFQLAPGRRAAVERALATRTAERVHLRARYFDTDDGRLAAAQLALRLRQEGDRWVQTLKGRGDGLMQRLEDEVPLPAAGGTDAEPVPTLEPSRHDGTHAGRALQAALAGGPAPRMVYGTDIRRLKRVLRLGGARIEVALDVGELIAGDARAAVCELEFELLDGPPQALFDLAGRWAARFGLVLDVTTKAERGQRLARGDRLAPVARAEEAALDPRWPLSQARARLVGASLAQALPNASALVGDAGGPDHLHQLRVGLRRLRTMLRAFGPADAARDETLSALFAALGSTRDADVLALTLAPAWQAAGAAGLAPPPPAPVPGADAALAALRAPTTAALWLQLLALATLPRHDAAADDAPWSDAAVAAVARWRRPLRRGLRQWQGLDDERHHRLRKRLKRLRYLLDASAGLWPAKALAAELDALRPLQDAIGHWNDLVVARRHLADRLADADSADRPALHFAAGWLAAQAQAADRGCVKAVKRWRRLPALKPKPMPKPESKRAPAAPKRRPRR